MPFPGGDLRHVHRHPQPFLVFAHALVGAGQRRRALLRRALELLVGLLQRCLRPLALGNLVLQLVVERRQRPRLAKQLDEHRHLGAQDRRR